MPTALDHVVADLARVLKSARHSIVLSRKHFKDVLGQEVSFTTIERHMKNQTEVIRKIDEALK